MTLPGPIRTKSNELVAFCWAIGCGQLQPFGYAGGIQDEDSHLVHFGAREYDPESGRWTSADPAGVAVSVNLYVYANNEPLGWHDPTGFQPQSYVDNPVPMPGLAGAGRCPTYEPAGPPTYGQCLLNANAQFAGLIGLEAGLPAYRAYQGYRYARELTAAGKLLGSWGSGLGMGFLRAGALAAAQTYPGLFLLGSLAAGATGYTIGAAAMCSINTSYYGQ